MHYIGDGLNPYEQAIAIIGKTLAVFDEDNLIPCYGFGDGMLYFIFFVRVGPPPTPPKLCLISIISLLAASTHDQDVFSFYSDGRFCNGFEEVLSRYREIVPNLKLAGLNCILLV